MTNPKAPAPVRIDEAPPRTRPSNYPEPFASRMRGRTIRPLGDLFGLKNFGANLTTLAPGAVSSLRHAHTRQDEFVYVLSGSPTLLTDHGETPMQAGQCIGFPAGTGDAHTFVNRSGEDCVLLVVGDRSAGDAASYPDDDIVAVAGPDGWRFSHKDGMPYPT
jgi:uncharacterized cupin superfamily protein